MDRNSMAHFGAAPGVEISRSKFPLSHGVTGSGQIGDLIPFDCWEVLPGDTFKVSTSKVIRLTTPLAPFMGNLFADFYWFYAPSRILWDHWKQFCGESNKAWTPSVQYSIPQLVVEQANTGFLRNSIADYLGIPTKESFPDAQMSALSVNALPFRMYSMVANEWFRDQNLVDPLLTPTGDEDSIAFTSENEVPYTPGSYARGGPCFRAAKKHDVFTSSLPAPQKGVDVLIPGGTVQLQAPVVSVSQNHLNAGPAVNWSSPADGSSYYSVVRGGSNGDPMTRNVSGATQGIKPLNLVVDATGYENVNSVTLGTINELRNAFQIQKLLEADARGGTRYRELLKYHFGVTSPDASQQIPEYLGGNRVPIQIHQVTQTAGTSEYNAYFDETRLGYTGAQSVTNDSNDDVFASFTENGYIMGFMVVRYEHSYSQGLHKMWSKKNRFDFYYPELANIGEQAVHTYELDCRFGNNNVSGENPNADRVFGYQEAWYDYRYIPDRVCASMRPGIQNSLSVWNISDYYESQPTLSEGWICEDRNNIDRVLSVRSSEADPFWFDIWCSVEATRPMPVYSIPGLADHH